MGAWLTPPSVAVLRAWPIVLAICLTAGVLSLVTMYALHVHVRVAKAATPKVIEDVFARLGEVQQSQMEQMETLRSWVRTDLDHLHRRVEHLEARDRDRGL